MGKEAAASAFRLLKQLLADAERHKIIRTNPALSVGTPRAPKHVDRTLSSDECRRLLDAVTKPGDRTGTRRDQPAPRVPDPASRLFITLMLDAGLRWQEAAGLHGFRVDLLRKRIRVQEVIERGRAIKTVPKSAAGQREVALTDELTEDLSRHMVGRARESLLFTEADGRPLDYANWLKRVWKPTVDAADLAAPLPTPHDCRHTFGSLLADEGVPVHEIAALMGHSSLRAVERYVHAGEARMDRARAALGARRAHGRAGTAESPAARVTGDGA